MFQSLSRFSIEIFMGVSRVFLVSFKNATKSVLGQFFREISRVIQKSF